MNKSLKENDMDHSKKSRFPSRHLMFIVLHLVTVFLVCPIDPAGAEDHTGSANAPSPLVSHQAHWDYMGIEGPEHWGILDSEYMLCEKGREQSPINVVTAFRDSTPNASLTFHYQSSPVHVVNNGHTVQVNYKAGSKVVFDGTDYELRQFHFHDPSEHHIGGNAYPMEMHLVHQSPSGHLLVIGVMIQIGTPHTVLDRAGSWVAQQLGHRIPIEGEEIRSGLVLDVKDLLPKDTSHFYSYHGSLTTPPCSEGVQWIILKNPIEVSAEQVQRFVRTVGPNARPLQLPSGRRLEDQ